jgi:hypothetical protein
LVNGYLVQDSVRQLKKLISELIKAVKNGRSEAKQQSVFKVDAINYEIKGKGIRKLILYCPFGIEVHVSEFMLDKIIEKWGEKSE